jgi:hypothetical protein
VDAYMSVIDKDSLAPMVLIWGADKEIDKNGKETLLQIHEVWAFNKDGNVAWMKQYAGQ